MTEKVRVAAGNMSLDGGVCAVFVKWPGVRCSCISNFCESRTGSNSSFLFAQNLSVHNFNRSSFNYSGCKTSPSLSCNLSE